ncbi:MAG: YdcF family protein [Candidatus Saccharimonas sp.]
MILKVIIGFLIFLALAAWIVGSYLAPDDLKHCDVAPSAETPCQKADAIVAVSGGDTPARAAEAIKLYKAGWADLLIFSGAAADKSGPSNAEVMEKQAMEAGVDQNAIVIEGDSQTTTENAKKTTNIFSSRGIKSAIIVTSAYHERRATLEFKHSAPSVDFRSHPVAHDKQWGHLWWLTPTGWILALPETVKSLILSASGTG